MHQNVSYIDMLNEGIDTMFHISIWWMKESRRFIYRYEEWRNRHNVSYIDMLNEGTYTLFHISIC